ncbi:DUF2939 domain-containing protein [Novosphingobium sp. PS1R-30]|uniref:DUF2939 domain-containing protein n=1 Tax=Novosphingobium anseongense TaxID=3133436 RepID=A0ABU8S1R8_9SPHN
MSPRKKAKVTILGFNVAAAALVGTWYWRSPVATIAAIRQAAIEEDAVELAKGVDLAALRDQMRLRVGRSGSASDGQNSPIGMALASAMVDSTFDLGAVQRTILTGSPYAALGAGSDEPVGWTVSSRGIDVFRARIAANSDNPIELMFRRDILRWKLSGIKGIPDPAALREEQDARRDLVLNFPANRQDRRVMPNGAEFFSVSGTITNVGDVARELGAIVVTLRDRSGRRLSSLEITPPRSRLEHGETTEVNEAFTDIPVEATTAEISWKPRQGIASPVTARFNIRSQFNDLP